MPKAIQCNVGRRIARNLDIVEFLEQVWRIDTDGLPEDELLSLPWPLRRFLLRYKTETLRSEDMAYSTAPSGLAVEAAESAWQTIEDATLGLMQTSTGRWEDLSRFKDDMEEWQKVLCIVQFRKASPRPIEDELQTSEYSRCRARIRGDEAGFATRLMYLLNSNIRSWVSGILIQDAQVSFWYADRMGVIVSARFDCLDKPNLLYLAGLGIGACSRKNLGICSFVSFTKKVGEYHDVDADADMDFRQSLIELNRATLDSGEVLEEKESIIVGCSPLSFPDVNSHELIGRGTVILPVLTACVGAWERLIPGAKSVLKAAWADVTLPVEDEIVRLIRKRLRQCRPDMLKHVTEIKASLTRTMDEMELPRAYMYIEEEERVFRMQLLLTYADLQDVSSVADFKTCFLDVVTAHHWVYETSGILHRDISAGNIMIRYIDGVQRGVLVDWDLASAPTIRGTQNVETYGTVPFTSVDFGAEWRQNEYSYRHDLEAFMHLLAWFCACFVPSRQCCERSHLSVWYEESKDRTNWCRRFLAENLDQVRAKAHPDYKDLVDEWVKPLSKYFLEVTGTTYSFLTALHRLDRDEWCGKRLEEPCNLPTVRREIERFTRFRNEAITYEGFMACLGQ